MKNTTNNHQDSIAIVWTIEDVAQCCERLHIDLSPDGQRRVLHLLERDHDATIGINWDVIDAQIRELAASQTPCS